MSGILCAWANLPDEVAEWYKDTYLQSQQNIDSIHTIHCEVTASGMEHEPVGKLDAPWPYLTILEVKDVKWANKQIEAAMNDLPEEAKTGPLKHVHFDVRSYKEVKRWQDDDWEGMGGDDIEHVASIAAMEWTVAADKEEEVLKFYQETVGPTIASSPDVLRFRLFKLDYAMTIDKEQECSVKDVQQLHKYFTLVELEAEEWPWDVVVDLAEEQGWKDYFETQQVVKWQLSHYLVNKTISTHKQEASAS